MRVLVDFEQEISEAHCEKLPIYHALRRHIMVAFINANCSPSLRAHDSINGTMIVPSASKSALDRCDSGSIVVSVSRPRIIIVPIIIRVVAVRIIPIILEWIEKWETKRVDKDESSIVEAAEAVVTIIVAIVPPPVRACHGPWRKAQRRPHDRGSRHHLRGVWGRRC